MGQSVIALALLAQLNLENGSPAARHFRETVLTALSTKEQRIALVWEQVSKVPVANLAARAVLKSVDATLKVDAPLAEQRHHRHARAVVDVRAYDWRLCCVRAALFSVVDDVFDLRMQQLRDLVTPSWYATPYLKVCVKHCGDDLVVELRVVQLCSSASRLSRIATRHERMSGLRTCGAGDVDAVKRVGHTQDTQTVRAGSCRVRVCSVVEGAQKSSKATPVRGATMGRKQRVQAAMLPSRTCHAPYELRSAPGYSYE